MNGAPVPGTLIKEALSFRNKFKNTSIDTLDVCNESSLTIEGNLNTSVKQTVSSSDNRTRTRSQPQPTECRYLIDSVLSYIHYSLQSGTQEKIQMVVLSHFPSAQIAESKDALWKHCGSSVLGEKSKRRNTPNRLNLKPMCWIYCGLLLFLIEWNKFH